MALVLPHRFPVYRESNSGLAIRQLHFGGSWRRLLVAAIRSAAAGGRVARSRGEPAAPALRPRVEPRARAGRRWRRREWLTRSQRAATTLSVRRTAPAERDAQVPCAKPDYAIRVYREYSCC